MNILSTELSVSLASPILNPAIPIFDSAGASLARLGGTSLTPGLDAGQFQTQEMMMQMAFQMFAMLSMLMIGQPNSAFSQSPLGGILAPASLGGSDQAGKGTRIQGGKALYGHEKGMFHRGKSGAPDSYAFENSPAGIKFAAEHGYASIDIDLQITKDGVPVATHWSKPMAKDGFYDPLGQLKPKTKVSQMTLAEVMRLRNKDGQSRIYPLASMIGELKKNGIAGDFEAKDDPRFATDQMMGYIADLVRGSGIKANMKSIDRGPRSMKILEAAQRAGFWTRFATGGGKRGKAFGYGS